MMMQITEMRESIEGIGRRRRRLARHIPFAQRATTATSTTAKTHVLHVLHLRTGRHRDAARRRWIRVLAVAVVVRRRAARTPVHFHVLAKRRWMRVRFVAARYATIVRLVWRVHVRVLFAVGRVGEAAIAALVLAFEWFLAWNKKRTAILVDCFQFSSRGRLFWLRYKVFFFHVIFWYDIAI